MDLFGSTIAEDDPEWDQFVENSPFGEFQQTSAWARYKQKAGWRLLRILLRQGGRIAGGAQILWRQTRLGRIGYISKGPVVSDPQGMTFAALAKELTHVARQNRLAALIVQPPSRDRSADEGLRRNHFSQSPLVDTITASLQVDVSVDVTSIEAAMNKTSRKHVRQATRKKIAVRQGGEEDIGDFFRLMCETAERIGVRPNPSSAEALRELYRALRGDDHCRLTFAELDNRRLAGLFCIRFKDIVYVWKKGSNPEDLKHHPVDLLYHEAFCWAHTKKFRCCDFCSMDRTIAENLQNGMPLTKEQLASRDFYNLGFGGKPILMPGAYAHFPNPLARLAHHGLIKNPPLLRVVKNRFAGIGT
jgi:CelD/BcsL family acetyltransferase involved in cellulose biosynthesis